MIKIALIGILSTFSLFVKGQSIIGEYDTRNDSHTNDRHYEELILNQDYTFTYFTSMEFIKIHIDGFWRVKNDTLILNEKNPCCNEKIRVKEEHLSTVPKGVARFSVYTFEGESIDYHLVLTEKNSTRTIWSKIGESEVKVDKLKKFYLIINSLVYSPEYQVMSRRSNHFKVMVAKERFFLDEKWLIRDGHIVPIGWDNAYAGYYLMKRK